MTSRPRARLTGWDAAYLAGLAALAIVSLVAEKDHTQARVLAGLASLGAIAVGYLLLGRRALREESGPLPFVVFLTAAIGVAVSFVPYLATLQALVIPTVWVLIGGRWYRPIVATLAVGVSVTAGTVLAAGARWEVLGEVLIYQSLSMIFSVAFGLWITRIGEQGEEKARLLDELQGAQGALEIAHRETGAAAERERLAREIHDTIAQSLTSLVLLAQRTRAELGAAGVADATDAADADAARADSATSDAARAADADAARAAAAIERALGTVDLIETTARDALGEARALVATIAPVPFGDGGLASVLARLAARFERETGVEVRSSVGFASGSGERPLVPREVEVVLLRCAQEGLANVRKHAAARRAGIDVIASNGAIALEVTDDGVGPAGYSPAVETGFGLSGMRDRLALVGGTVELLARPDGGSALVVRVPLGGGPAGSGAAGSDAVSSDAADAAGRIDA